MAGDEPAERIADLREAGIRPRYPAVTPGGHAVDIDDLRLHFGSRDSDDSTSRCRATSVWTRALPGSRAFVTERLGATVDELEPAVFGGGMRSAMPSAGTVANESSTSWSSGSGCTA